MDIRQLLIDNPPDNFKNKSYWLELSSVCEGETSDSIRGKVRRFLAKEGFPQTIFGVGMFIASVVDKKNEKEGDLTVTYREGKKTIQYKSHVQIYTKEQAIEFFEIDTETYKVERFSHRAWPTTMSDKKGGYIQPMNYYTRIDLVEKVVEIDFEKVKSDLKSSIPRIKGKAINPGGELCLELAIKDLHLGKMGYDPETLERNWTLKDAVSLYMDAIETAISIAGKNNISEFFLPVGNDQFNIDNRFYETTNGTGQGGADFWWTIMDEGIKMTKAAITRLAKIAPVYVYVIPGNHDYHSSFSLGFALQCAFEKHPNVKINNDMHVRKRHIFGQNMIGMCHGHNIKTKDRQYLLAVEWKHDFASTKYRFVHHGHLHASKTKKLNPQSLPHISTIRDEEYGVEVECCPSMSPLDLWHHKKLYVGNMRRSKFFVYHQEDGKISEHYYNL